MRVSEEAAEAEARARAAMASIAAAAAPPPVKSAPMELSDGAGVREQAAAYFSVGEEKRAVDLLVQHLNKTSGNAPREVWFMLMDAYQAMGQQAAFEKSARLFADFFNISPPSWVDVPGRVTSVPAVGRNVLVMDGLPSQAHPEKLKDYISAARKANHAKLDLSRTRMDEDHAQRSDDLRVILNLMRRLRRYHVPTLLMGENQLVEILRGVIQQDLPVPQPTLYWELLLEFMQWRGQEEAFEDLAVSYAKKFGLSAPGYEFSGSIALAPDDQAESSLVPGDVSLAPPPRLDDGAMEKWCERLEVEFASHPPSIDEPLRIEFEHVQSVSFSAAGLLAARINQWGLPPESLMFSSPSELVLALFEITGVQGLVHFIPRKR